MNKQLDEENGYPSHPNKLIMFVTFFSVLFLTGAVSFRVTPARFLSKYRFNLAHSKVPLQLISPTKDIFEKIKFDNQTESFGAGAITTYKALLSVNENFEKLKSQGFLTQNNRNIVQEQTGRSVTFDEEKVFDVIVVGGTLGIFYAAVLQKRGYNVAVIERGKIKGRKQEWNISRKELEVLSRLQIINDKDLEDTIAIEFNPVRVGFKTDINNENDDGFEVYVRDILNLGVKPDVLIAYVLNNFKIHGGTILEDSNMKSIEVFDNIVQLKYSSQIEDEEKSIFGKLIIDAMGNASPIVNQIRAGKEPDGVCVVVGSCAKGFDMANNTYSDLIYTNTPIASKIQETKQGPVSSQLQYFWEAFPSAGDIRRDQVLPNKTFNTDYRTTYLFTYMDAKPERPSILSIMDDYWKLLPAYQGKSIEELEFARILFAYFLTYRESPIQTPFHRILQVGDASGVQSPLSFGGFGALTRHIERITNSISEAFDEDIILERDLINSINAYQPNLACCWMFQRAMTVPIPRTNMNNPKDLITKTLSNSFRAMTTLQSKSTTNIAMRAFLQDVIQFLPLLQTLLLAAKQDFWSSLTIIPHVGIPAMLDFLRHFWMLGLYTFYSKFFSGIVERVLSWNIWTKRQKYLWRRRLDAWKYGSGLDYLDQH